MTYAETLAAYEAASLAHAEFYNNVFLAAKDAHQAGTMTSEAFLAIRAQEKALLADFDAIYAVMCELEEPAEEVEADPEFAF